MGKHGKTENKTLSKRGNKNGGENTQLISFSLFGPVFCHAVYCVGVKECGDVGEFTKNSLYSSKQSLA